MKAFFRKPKLKEMAPWISSLIELFRDRRGVELHIVSPNVFSNREKIFKLNNIDYHFYQYRPFFIPRKIYNYLHIETLLDYALIKTRVKKIITKINPDIIHLHGAENPYYSAGILPLLESYPVLLTIQGFIRNTSTLNRVIKKRIEIEENIIKNLWHIGVRTKEMSAAVLKLNPNSSLHFHNYPLTVPAVIKEESTVETFDILFFARVTKDKGIEDLLEAIPLIKKTKPDISLYVIGGSSKSYFEFLKNRIKQLNIENNVNFLGFIDTQQEIYQHAVQAKICVLPTYHDIISGTIIESMFLKLPVIAYDVGSIHEVNEKDNIIRLVEKGNILKLAKEIEYLLSDAKLRGDIAEKGYFRAKELFDNGKILDDLMQAYTAILKNQNN